jgi:LacI family transcriptional regulator
VTIYLIPFAESEMPQTSRIGLLVESSHGYGRAVLRGIAAYSEAFVSWVFYHEERAFDDPIPPELKAWKPDGVIARVSSPIIAKQLQRLRIPIVHLYERPRIAGNYHVSVDHGEIVRLAIEHLRERGLQNYAYVGFPNASFSTERKIAFEKNVVLWGYRSHVYTTPALRSVTRLATIETRSMRSSEALATWLERLPKPVGILCCNDMLAQQVLGICNERGIAVPGSVAVIGVDNDEVRCELSRPALSSIDPNAFRVGYEAALLLHRALRKQQTPRKKIIVKPTGVVQRKSTDVLVFADSIVADLVQMIREQACHGLTLKKLTQKSGISRATLDRWFLNNLGRSPRAEIDRVRIQRTCELLGTTELPLKQVAKLAGFAHRETMHRAFTKATRQTPAAYRRESSCTKAMSSAELSWKQN